MSIASAVRRRRFRAALLASTLFAFAHSSRAQDAAPSAPVLVAPRLVTPAEPDYPPEEKARGETAVVVLTLEIDTAGVVRDAVVAASGGASFDTAALEAARKLVFSPATRDGHPIVAKIPFRFAFEQNTPSEPPPAPAPAPDPDPQPTKSAEPATDDQTAAPGAFVDIEVRGEREPHEATKRVIEPVEIAHMPGANGDALHAVENLPGVARPSGISSDLVVRGSAPQDTAVFADGVWLINAFHFGGITSVIPTEILQRLDFYPGNFSPEYGRQMGGIIDIGIRSPRKDRLGGLLQFDLLDGRILAEGPLGRSTRFLVAGRRSWVDAWLGPVLRSGGTGVSLAPAYYDYQAMLEHDLSDSTTARLLFFGADDRFAVTVGSPAPDDPGLGGDISSTEAFLRLQARLDTRLSDRVRWINMASLGTNTQHLGLGGIRADGEYQVVDSRSDLRAKLAPWMTAVAGVALLAGSYDVTIISPPRPASGEVYGPIFAAPKVELAGHGMLWRPGAYAMFELAPISRLKVLPGVRLDYSSEASQWTLDPRITARFDVAAGYPRTTLKGGAGVFHQPPSPDQALPPFGSPTVRTNYAVHYSLGVEQQISRDVELSFEGFYKDLRELIVTRNAATTASGGSDFVNAGSGRSYGTELLLRWKPGGRFFGWLAYTMSRSERRNAPSEPLATFAFDQTHILNALAGYQLGRGWSVGARWRYVTGNPYTPYVGAVADLDAGAYAPVSSPFPNSARTAPFHSLDLRVDKTWTFPSWKLTAYVDVRNVYNRKNAEAMTYNYNFSQSQPLAGLPLLPIIGLRGEL